MISTVDPESRHRHKNRSSYRDGYKAHIVVEPTTGSITRCDLTPANQGDGPTGMALLNHGPTGLDVLADSAYGSGDSHAALANAGHNIHIKPWPLGRNTNLGDNQFSRDDFTVDYTARTVTCPNEATTQIAPSGVATFKAKCRGCPVRSRCTTAKDGKSFLVTEHDHHLAANRARWSTDTDLIANCRRTGHSSSAPLHGSSPTAIAFSTRAAVINLKRLINLGLDHNGTAWNLAPTN